MYITSDGSYAGTSSIRRRVPDAFIRRYGGRLVSNPVIHLQSFLASFTIILQRTMDIIQFDKTGAEEDRIGAGTDGGLAV